MSWWYSKPVEDNKYVMIEDKMEAFQNTISKLQSEIENLKCEKDNLIVIVEKLKTDFEKDIQTLKNDFENYKIKPIEPDPIWYDTIDYMKPEHISKEIYISPLELLKKDEKDCLDDFLNGAYDIPILAEEGTIKIGGGMEVEDCHIETKQDKAIRKSERIKNKNLKRSKRISYNNKEVWKI